MHNPKKQTVFRTFGKLTGKGKGYKDMAIKVKDILESKLVDADTKVYLRFWNGDNCTFVVGRFNDHSILKHYDLIIFSFVWQTDGCLYIDIDND